jgi:hypothetical protein
MGMSMRVERSTAAQVRDRLSLNKRKLEEKAKPASEQFDFDAHIASLQEDETRIKVRHRTWEHCSWQREKRAQKKGEDAQPDEGSFRSRPLPIVRVCVVAIILSSLRSNFLRHRLRGSCSSSPVAAAVDPDLAAIMGFGGFGTSKK